MKSPISMPGKNKGIAVIGKTLAHYEITSQLGKGGMEDVYRAKELKLGCEWRSMS